jgi:large subunit ribosomal protein L21e
MIQRKNIKSRGKISLSKYFQELKTGEKVAIVREQSSEPKFPIRIQGKTGVIMGKKGEAYVIRLMDGNERKTFIIDAIHLKKIFEVSKIKLNKISK